MIKIMIRKISLMLTVSAVVGFYATSVWAQTSTSFYEQNVYKNDKNIQISVNANGAEVTCYGQTFQINELNMDLAKEKCAEIKNSQSGASNQGGNVAQFSSNSSNNEKPVTGVAENNEKPQITEAQKDRDASTPTPPPAVQVAKPEEEIKSTDFTGIAKEYQVIPNTLAIYCQANAQDLATDRTKMVGCVNKIISKLKADRAETLRNVTEPVRIEMLEEAMMLAISKDAQEKDKRDVNDEIKDKSGESKTAREDVAASVYNIWYLTESILDMQNLFAEPMKYKAFTGIYEINPSVIEDEKDKDGQSSSGNLTIDVQEEKAKVTKTVVSEEECEGDNCSGADMPDINGDEPASGDNGGNGSSAGVSPEVVAQSHTSGGDEPASGNNGGNGSSVSVSPEVIAQSHTSGGDEPASGNNGGEKPNGDVVTTGGDGGDGSESGQPVILPQRPYIIPIDSHLEGYQGR